jgi:hypothetical protein
VSAFLFFFFSFFGLMGLVLVPSSTLKMRKETKNKSTKRQKITSDWHINGHQVGHARALVCQIGIANTCSCAATCEIAPLKVFCWLPAAGSVSQKPPFLFLVFVTFYVTLS